MGKLSWSPMRSPACLRWPVSAERRPWPSSSTSGAFQQSSSASLKQRRRTHTLYILAVQTSFINKPLYVVSAQHPVVTGDQTLDAQKRRIITSDSNPKQIQRHLC